MDMMPIHLLMVRMVTADIMEEGAAAAIAIILREEVKQPRKRNSNREEIRKR
jgi:hypothetical protein